MKLLLTRRLPGTVEEELRSRFEISVDDRDRPLDKL